VRQGGDCPEMCPIAAMIWEGGNWGNPFLSAAGKATRSATLAIQLLQLYSLIPYNREKTHNKNLNKHFFAFLLTS